MTELVVPEERPRRVVTTPRLPNKRFAPRPRGPGRVTKLTPEVSKKICDAVRAGNYLSVAAQYAGVGSDTVYDWVKRGRGTHQTRRSGPEFVRFVNDLDEAEAASEVAAVLHWRSAMPKDHNAAQKWLKVRHPERWSEDHGQLKPTSYGLGIQVNVGQGQSGTPTASSGQIGSEAPGLPIGALLEDNPSLIGPTMQILDQLLPLAGAAHHPAIPVLNSGVPDVVEGEFSILEVPEAPQE